MTKVLYFENLKTRKRYRLVKLDNVKGEITLRGELGGEFTEPYSKERFEKMGYRPVMVEEADAVVS